MQSRENTYASTLSHLVRQSFIGTSSVLLEHARSATNFRTTFPLYIVHVRFIASSFLRRGVAVDNFRQAYFCSILLCWQLLRSYRTSSAPVNICTLETTHRPAESGIFHRHVKQICTSLTAYMYKKRHLPKRLTDIFARIRGSARYC